MTIQLPRLRMIALCGVAAAAAASAIGGYFPFGGAAVMIACWMLFIGAIAAKPRSREVWIGAIPAAVFAVGRTVGYSYETLDSYGLLLKNAKTLLSGGAAMAAMFAAALCAVLLLTRFLEADRKSVV